MYIVEQAATLIRPPEAWQVYQDVAETARECTLSQNPSTPENDAQSVRNLVRRKHYTPFEQVILRVQVVTDIGIGRELLRHRHASPNQESTRYCDYGGQGLQVVRPSYLKGCPLGAFTEGDLYMNFGAYHEATEAWLLAMLHAESAYQRLRVNAASPGEALPPEFARDVLPLSTKSGIKIACNLREWRLIFDQRVLGLTGRPHPRMRELLLPLLADMAARYPAVFEDLLVLAGA